LESWRQGDGALRRFCAPEACLEENALLARLHGRLLGALAQAALRLESWSEALDAAERALELCGEDCKAWYRRALALEALGRFDASRASLARLQELLVGRADRERLERDCQRRRLRLVFLEARHRAEQRRMLRRGLQRGVFGEGRALRGPGEGKRLTREGAASLLLDLELAFREPWFLRRVDRLLEPSRLGTLAFEAQRLVLAKWGFGASGIGLLEMRKALQDHTHGPSADERLREQAERVNRAVCGLGTQRLSLGV